MTITDVNKEGADVIFNWWDDPVSLDYVVWRSSNPSDSVLFSDVTSEDPDPTDNSFRDSSGGIELYFIIQGRGPDGDGQWGHFGL